MNLIFSPSYQTIQKWYPTRLKSSSKWIIRFHVWNLSWSAPDWTLSGGSTELIVQLRHWQERSYLTCILYCIEYYKLDSALRTACFAKRMNGPQRTACLAKGYVTHTDGRTHGQYAILSLAGSQNLCQTITSPQRHTLQKFWQYNKASLGETPLILSFGRLFKRAFARQLLKEFRKKRRTKPYVCN